MWRFCNSLFMGDLTPEEKNLLWKVAITVTLSFHILAAYGFVPFIHTQFVTRTSQIKIERAIDVLRQGQLVEAVERERRNVCTNIRDKNTAALNYSVRKRDELLRDYVVLTDKSMPSVSCDELGISNDN